jgi:hypothetical protein
MCRRIVPVHFNSQPGTHWNPTADVLDNSTLSFDEGSS